MASSCLVGVAPSTFRPTHFNSPFRSRFSSSRRSRNSLLKPLPSRCLASPSPSAPISPSARRANGATPHLGSPPLESDRRIRRTTSNRSSAAPASSLESESPESEVAEEDNILSYVSEKKRVVLVRHGESTWNAIGRIQGSSDISELTPKGESQAEISRQMLVSDNFDVCFYSPLKRAAQTAKIIWGTRTKPMIANFDLREIDLYSFQGLNKEQGKEKFGEQYRMWQKDSVNFEIDGHYPVRELWGRARSVWTTILSHPSSPSILIVAHNAVIQALVATATGLGPEYFRQILQSNCGISVLDFYPKNDEFNILPYFSLNRINQTPNPPIGISTSGRKAKRKIILICNGSTDNHSQQKFPSSEVEPLNILGLIQSRKTAELLLDVKFEKIFCSPFVSSFQTAEAISEIQEGAECLGADCIARYVEIVKLEQLKNVEFGTWKGKAKPEISHHEKWQRHFCESPPPGAEPFSSLHARVRGAWDDILSELFLPIPTPTPMGPEKGEGGEGGRSIVVVTHEVAIASIVAACLGLPHGAVAFFNFNPGSISVVDFPDDDDDDGSAHRHHRGHGAVVRCLNYTSHFGRWAVPITRPTSSDDDF